MYQFIEYLNESLETKKGKNTHLEHLEDEIINSGYAGFSSAVKSLRGVMAALRGNAPSSHDITVKWDGSPAIICGIDPASGKFFVGTKSVFNVTPKLNFTNADIDLNHPAPGLNVKLRSALRWLKKLGITGILQGDLLFTQGDLKKETIDGQKYITFQPNTIKYAVPSESALARKMSTAQVGIVFHTAYTGDSIQNLTAVFNPSLSNLSQTKAVWFDNATLRSVNRSLLFSKEEVAQIQAAIAGCMRQALASRRFMDILSKNSSAKTLVKEYINSLVRLGTLSPDANQMIVWMKEKAGSNPKPQASATISWIESHRNEINAVFTVHGRLTHIKRSVLAKLSAIESDVSTFVKSGNGYKVTAPEGFVAIDRLSNSALKLVDRLEFSKSNFNRNINR